MDIDLFLLALDSNLSRYHQLVTGNPVKKNKSFRIESTLSHNISLSHSTTIILKVGYWAVRSIEHLLNMECSIVLVYTVLWMCAQITVKTWIIFAVISKCYYNPLAQITEATWSCLWLSNYFTFRAYEIWGGPEGLATEIWNRKKAYEESERYRKGKVFTLAITLLSLWINNNKGIKIQQIVAKIWRALSSTSKRSACTLDLKFSMKSM